MGVFSERTNKFINAKLTQLGKKSIASGDFNIRYFEVGDSEYDYENPNNKQKVLTPIEGEINSKTPYLMDNANGIQYGVPIRDNQTTLIRNVMGPAGFVNGFKEYVEEYCEGSGIKTHNEEFELSLLNGSDHLSVADVNKYDVGDTITLIYNSLCGVDSTTPNIGRYNKNGLTYKVTSILNGELYLDRNLPNLTISGKGVIIKNEFYLNYDVRCNEYDNLNQQDSWLLSVVWGDGIIGSNGSTIDRKYSDYNNMVYSSMLNYFGYKYSQAQTIMDWSGNILTDFDFTDGDGFLRTTPEEQRCIAFIHYSHLKFGDFDKDKGVKYNDYISTEDNLENTIHMDVDGNVITDKEYFEVYAPFIQYHRSKDGTIGLRMLMGDEDYFLVSTVNDKMNIRFRTLVDENGYKIGKIFPDHKLIAVEDQEIVATLDYRSNRNYTLPKPKITTIPTNDNNALFQNQGEEQSYFVTYMINGGTEGLYSLPCNYYSKIVKPNIDSISKFNLNISFNEEDFKHLVDDISMFSEGFIIQKFHILIQEATGVTPNPESWKVIDYSWLLPTRDNLVTKSDLCEAVFTIDGDIYESSPIFDLEEYFTDDYLKSPGDKSPNFGETVYFPGSINLVRSTKIETMNFLVNLPDKQFTITQNPSYKNGDKYLTEINLLNENKDVLVTGKVATPIKRVGTQVFSIKIDF